MSIVRNSRRFYPYVYKWTKDVDPLLPEHYKQRCREFMQKDPLPVHWRPKTERYTIRESTGERLRVQNVPVDVRFPRECNAGLWGGEGFVMGLTKRTPQTGRKPAMWRPWLHKRVLYSEILDKHLAITVTMRTLDLIDDHHGLDHYILATNEVDLCSKLGMDLKRRMLVALATKSCRPDDPAKQAEILERYAAHVLPLEEAQWVGLSVEEALAKAQADQATHNPPTPLKDIFMKELLQQFSENKVEEKQKDSFFEKLNPFTRK